MKEDRNTLRSSIKDLNEELILLLRKHKKKIDLPSLQIELRKILSKLKGKAPSQSSIAQSQSNLDKKPQASKSNTKNTEKPFLEKSPDRKISKVDVKKDVESPEPSKGNKRNDKSNERNRKKPEQIRNDSVPSQNVKKITDIIERKSENIEKKPDNFEKKQIESLLDKRPSEISEKLDKKHDIHDKKTELIDKKTELSEKKHKPLKKMENIDENIKHNDEKYETPSFKNQPQPTFRAEKPKVFETESTKPLIARRIRINPNANAQNFFDASNSKKDLEKQVDILLGMKEINEFSGQKIEVFHEDDVYNIADFSLPIELEKEKTNIPVIEEKTKKAAVISESLDIKPVSDKLKKEMLSPVKSDSLQSTQRKEILRPSVLKTIKFITEKPNFNGKIIKDIQKNLGLADFPPEIVFDRIMGDIHLSITSRTYFKYKIEVLIKVKN